MIQVHLILFRFCLPTTIGYIAFLVIHTRRPIAGSCSLSINDNNNFLISS